MPKYSLFIKYISPDGQRKNHCCSQEQSVKLWMMVLYNHRVRLFLKEGKRISHESNFIKETRGASFVKSRGLDSKALERLGLFFSLYQQTLLVTTSIEKIKPVGA